jgi:hypothetical protein
MVEIIAYRPLFQVVKVVVVNHRQLVGLRLQYQLEEVQVDNNHNQLLASQFHLQHNRHYKEQPLQVVVQYQVSNNHNNYSSRVLHLVVSRDLDNNHSSRVVLLLEEAAVAAHQVSHGSCCSSWVPPRVAALLEVVREVREVQEVQEVQDSSHNKAFQEEYLDNVLAVAAY